MLIGYACLGFPLVMMRRHGWVSAYGPMAWVPRPGDPVILLQLGVFRFGLLEDGNVGVGVFPEPEEVLVCSAGLGEGVLLWHGRPKL